MDTLEEEEREEGKEEGGREGGRGVGGREGEEKGRGMEQEKWLKEEKVKSVNKSSFMAQSQLVSQNSR